MTRRCEIHKIGVDVPCLHKSSHFIKFISKRLGDKKKSKIWICQMHYELLQDKDQVADLLGCEPHEAVASDRFQGRLSS